MDIIHGVIAVSFRLCSCVHVQSERSRVLLFPEHVRDPLASVGLWYFTFPFRQRISRLPLNERMTGSSIWRLLYGPPVPTISRDESRERRGERAGQPANKTHRYTSAYTRQAVAWLHNLSGMQHATGGEEDCRVCGFSFILSHVIINLSSCPLPEDGQKKF